MPFNFVYVDIMMSNIKISCQNNRFFQFNFKFLFEKMMEVFVPGINAVI